MSYGYGNWMKATLDQANIQSPSLEDAYEESVDALQLSFIVLGTLLFVSSALSCLTIECRKCCCTTFMTMFSIFTVLIAAATSAGLLYFKEVSQMTID